MALAESQHHTSRGQKTARARGEARDALHGHVPEAPLPQGRILRHDVGHLPAPSLDVLVPQMVDQLPDIEQFLRALSPDPEQVIEVPKILPLDVPMRAALRVTQLVEQLVEVPTTVSYSSLQRTVEQHVDIPVFKVFSLDSVQQSRLPENAFLSGLWSRSLTLFLVEVFLVLSQVRVHLLLTLQLVLKNARMNLVKGFFRTFPQNKKSAKVTSHSGSELPPHPSSSTAAAQLEDSVKWVRLKDDKSGKPYYWNRRSFRTVWQPPPGVKVVWNASKNEEGARYFWHTETRVSSYDLPPLPPE